MNRKYVSIGGPEAKVCFCQLCGRRVVQMRYANGQPYLSDIVIGPSGRECAVLGEGNHYNLKRHHDCAAELKVQLQSASDSLQAAKSKIDSVEMHLSAARSVTPEAFAGQCEANIDFLKRLVDDIPSYEAKLPELQKDFSYWEARVAELQAKCDALAAGKSIVPSDMVAMNRVVEVVKGRKVPVGTVGRVFWMGDDSYNPGNIRIGIIDDKGTKQYTSACNVKVL